MTEANKHQHHLIQQYLNGTLDPGRMHELEKEALEDPFLAEALEGYASFDGSAQPHLSLLQRQLEDRIAENAEKKNLFFFTWQRVSVAAAASLLFVSASILFWMKGTNTESRIAAGPKKVEVNLTPDALEAPADQTKTQPSDTRIAPAATETFAAVPKQTTQVKVAAKSLTPEASPSRWSQVLAAKRAPQSEPASSLSAATPSLSREASPAEATIASVTSAPESVQVTAYGRTTERKDSQQQVFTASARSASYAKIQPLSSIQPVTGWKDFQAYVRANKRLSTPAEGAVNVVLIFMVQPNGKPDAFRIEQGINEQYNAEAIRLVKEGPLWIVPETGSSDLVRVRIDFKN
ncbi:MAG: hypothetical protein ACO1NU_10560 [Arcticibacter sp.]